MRTRKISQDAAYALKHMQDFKNTNTRVVVQWEYAYMFLHNNLIAKNWPNGLRVNFAGWGTRTTACRINHLMSYTEFRIKNWDIGYYNDENKFVPIYSMDWYKDGINWPTICVNNY